MVGEGSFRLSIPGVSLKTPSGGKAYMKTDGTLLLAPTASLVPVVAFTAGPPIGTELWIREIAYIPDQNMTGFGVMKIQIGPGVDIDGLTVPTITGDPWDWELVIHSGESVTIWIYTKNAADPVGLQVSLIGKLYPAGTRAAIEGR
jgi:hypothetical protein